MGLWSRHVRGLCQQAYRPRSRNDHTVQAIYLAILVDVVQYAPQLALPVAIPRQKFTFFSISQECCARSSHQFSGHIRFRPYLGLADYSTMHVLSATSLKFCIATLVMVL